MPSLTDNLGWIGVDRVEITDIALGGNETNTPNKNLRQLASRDKWLRDQLAAIVGLGDATQQASFNSFRDIGMAAIAQGRLTTAAGDPTPGTNQVDIGTLYYTPYSGDLISLWNGVNNRWEVRQFTERSLSLASLPANTNHDIFAYWDGDEVTLEAISWTTSTAGGGTRAQAITRRNGAWVKTSDNRKLLGTLRTTGAGLTEVSFDRSTDPARIFVQNLYNRIRAKVRRYDPALSWTWNSTLKRPWNGNLNNKIEVISATGEEMIQLVFAANAQSDDYLGGGQNGIGINSTSVDSCDYSTSFTARTNDAGGITAGLYHRPVTGYHYYQMLEYVFVDFQTQIFYGNIGGTFIPSAMIGVWQW